jgi:hypothetical protein
MGTLPMLPLPTSRLRRERKEAPMQRSLLIVSLSLAAGCAGIASRPEADVAPRGHWEGYLLHDGLRAPIAVALNDIGTGWTGTYTEGGNSLQLTAVQFDQGGHVHFELENRIAFDGALAGDTMAGTVTGASPGSFALSRDPALVFEPDRFFGSP